MMTKPLRWPLLLFLWFLSPMLWASMPQWTGIEILQFAQAAVKPEVIYAAAWPGIFKSEDRGKSWRPLKLPQLLAYQQVVVDPDDANHVMALPSEGSRLDGGQSAGFFESHDGGLAWSWRTVLKQSNGGVQQAATSLRRLRVDAVQGGGVWWGLVGQQLFRSDDRGQSWSADSRPAYFMDAEQSGTSLFALDGHTLLRSVDTGKSWQTVRHFEVADTDLLARPGKLLVLADGRLVLRYKQWLESLDQGLSWQAAKDGWARLPDVEPSDRGLPMPPWRQSCEVHLAGPSALLALCIWVAGPSPSAPCLQRSEDMGRNWTELGPRCRTDKPGTGLPSAWRPVSIHVDMSDPRILLASWVAGGVYRSEDGGRTWVHSDDGLLFPPDRLLDFGEAESAAFHEPPLYRAILHRDRAAFKQLLSLGADINADGNYLGSVLEADLKASQWRIRNGQSLDSMYFELREKGARIPSATKSEMFLTARQANLPEVMQDLIEQGYDWGRAGKSANETELSKAASWSGGKKDTAADLITNWIEAYIKAKKFPAADQTVADLFDMNRQDLGLRVLKAASQKTAFDRQHGEHVQSRREVFEYLIQKDQIFWAMRVLERLPPDADLTTGAREGKVSLFMLDLKWACDPATVGRFERHGAVFEWFSVCLANPTHTLAQRHKLLDWLDRTGRAQDIDWNFLPDDSDHQWLLSTKTYKKWKRENELNSGLIGVEIQRQHTGHPVIHKVRSASPAEQAGLLAGDIVLNVSGVDTQNLGITKVSEKIRGRPDSIAVLRIKRDAQILTFQVKRKAMTN